MKTLIDLLDTVELEGVGATNNFNIHCVADFAQDNTFDYLIEKYRDSDIFRGILNIIDERSRSGKDFIHLSRAMVGNDVSTQSIEEMKTLLGFLGFIVKDHTLVSWSPNGK